MHALRLHGSLLDVDIRFGTVQESPTSGEEQ